MGPLGLDLSTNIALQEKEGDWQGGLEDRQGDLEDWKGDLEGWKGDQPGARAGQEEGPAWDTWDTWVTTMHTGEVPL